MVAYRFRGQPCFYCGREADCNDHLVARARGGTDASHNLVPACQRCNSRKRDLSVDEFRQFIMLTEARYPVVFYGEDRVFPDRDFLFIASPRRRSGLVVHNAGVL